MRGGNLGFVAPDGTTAEIGVKVEAALVRRRVGSRTPSSCPSRCRKASGGPSCGGKAEHEGGRPTLERRPGIRQMCAHTRRREDQGARRAAPEGLDERAARGGLLDMLDVTRYGEIQPMRRPGSLATSRRPSGAPPAPVQGPGGLRYERPRASNPAPSGGRSEAPDSLRSGSGAARPRTGASSRAPAAPS